MKRHPSRLAWIPLAVLGTLCVLLTARKLDAATPAVLYVPADAVDLVPLEQCSVPQLPSSEYNAALGCGGVQSPVSAPAYSGDLDGLTTAIRTALAPYDVHVTNDRPPDYVPFYMLIPLDAPLQGDAWPSCANTIVNCGAAKRSRIATFAATRSNGCENAVPIQSALHAFGRMSGLEDVTAPEDPMVEPAGMPPQGDPPAVSFPDQCSELVVGTEGSCSTSTAGGCQPGFQNGHAQLLELYGPRREDGSPPEITNVEPLDGWSVPWPGATVSLNADVSDADPVIAVRWTLASVGGYEDPFTACTNAACVIATATDEWPIPVNVAADTYEVTLEASDFHGNVAPPVTHVVYFDPPPPLPPESTGTGTTAGHRGSTGATGDGASGPTTGSVSDGQNGTATGGADGVPAALDAGSRSCACGQAGTGEGGSGVVVLLVIATALGLGARSRRTVVPSPRRLRRVHTLTGGSARGRADQLPFSKRGR